MITEKLFRERMSYLELNFNVKCEKPYLKFVYHSTKDKFDDEDVRYGFNELFKKTTENWNKAYGYGGRPSIADWISYFQLKKRHEAISFKYNKIEVAIDNAKRGIRPAKKIEDKRTVSASKIKNLISTLTKKENV